MTQEEAYHLVCADTLSRQDERFIHQHVVDAYAAQTATPSSKPIGVCFALAGLHLALERGLSGREVQQTHMAMARSRPTWPTLPLPAERGAITALDVANAESAARDALILDWCACVWAAWSHAQPEVRALVAPFARGSLGR